MRGLIRCVILIILSISVFPASAKLKAQVDRSDIALGQSLNLVITVNDFNLKNLSFPFDTPDYQVVSNSSSTSFQIINGVTSQSKSYTFTIVPKRAGAIILPPASMSDGTNTYNSDPITISVRAGNPAPAAQQQAATPQVNSARAGSKVYKENIIARLETSTANPYKNQQVNIKLKIYHRGNLRTIQIPPLNLDDFIIYKDNTAREYQDSYNGMEYLVYELNFAVFPIKSGKLTIDGHKIEAVVVEDVGIGNSAFDPFGILNPFLVDKQKTFTTNSLTLNVRDLPAGAPRDFTGYVGELVVNNEINSYQVKAGDAISLKTKIYGTGNPKNLKIDNVKASKLFSTFKDKENLDEQIENSKQYFENIITTAIVPNKNSGKISIELKPLISFNPVSGKYEEHGAEVFEVNIQAGSTQVNGEKLSEGEEEPSQASPTEVKKEMLSVTEATIKNYRPLPYANNKLLFIILIAINLLALFASLIRKISGLNWRNLLSDEFSVAIKQVKNAVEVADISKPLRDLVAQADLTGAADLQKEIEGFFVESDQVNYGFKPAHLNNYGLQEQLEYFRTKAFSIIRKIKELQKLNGKQASKN